MCNLMMKNPTRIFRDFRLKLGQSGCEFCGHVGIHELKCYNEKRKTNVSLNKRLDKNNRLKNFQHEHYARKRTKKGKIDAKGFPRDVKEHFVFGQNVTKSLPSEIADALFKRDANKYYNLQFPGNLTKIWNWRYILKNCIVFFKVLTECQQWNSLKMGYYNVCKMIE